MLIRLLTGEAMKYRRKISIGLTIVVFVMQVVLVSRLVTAADTGGYPWADASTISPASYDWGYPVCHEPMQHANVCRITRTRSGQVYHVSDPWRYALRNCTSYVAWRVHSQHGLAIPGWGNATNWDNAARRAGYGVDTSPRAGDIAVWEGQYGHVAYVVEVNTDQTVNVEQYNIAGNGQFSRQARVRAHSYIHLPIAQPAPVPIAVPQQAPAVPVVVDPVPPPLVDPPKRADLVSDTFRLDQLSDTTTTDYSVVRDPHTKLLVVTAVQYTKTRSGRVEVSQSKASDGNTTWQSTYATVEMTHDKDTASYSLADYDSDGVLDLYQIKYKGNTSGNTEVRVLSGSTQYKQAIGGWRTNQPMHEAHEASYAVADHDGDGALDVFALQRKTTLPNQRMIILSGKQNFASAVGEWDIPVSTAKGQSVRIAVGDYNGDGQKDIFHIEQTPKPEQQIDTATSQSVVRVRNATTNYQDSLREWSLDEANPQLLLPVIP